jgi:phosphoribosylaminoimidazole (AIR) synthetase
LLVAVPPEKVDRLMQRFDAVGHSCWIVGEVVEGQGIEVVI